LPRPFSSGTVPANPPQYMETLSCRCFRNAPMKSSHLALCGLLVVALAPAAGQEVKNKKLPDKLPVTKLAPAKLIPNLCLVKYHITTESPECQAYFDQALGYFYSYVWIEAARSFETALHYDAKCPMAWWGLSRAIEKWGKGQHAESLKKAQELMPRASHR